MVAQFVERAEAGDEIIAHVLGVRGGEAYPFDPVDVIDHAQQIGKRPASLV